MFKTDRDITTSVWGSTIIVNFYITYIVHNVGTYFMICIAIIYICTIIHYIRYTQVWNGSSMELIKSLQEHSAAADSVGGRYLHRGRGRTALGDGYDDMSSSPRENGRIK